MRSTRWAVLSDVHSNYHALEAVLGDAETRGVEDVLFLGDAVGYGPDPQRCVKRLMEVVRSGGWVHGNHDDAMAVLAAAGGDEAAVNEALDERVSDRREPRFALRANWDLLELYPEALEFLAARPFETPAAGRYYLVHGGCRNGRPATTSTTSRFDAWREFETLERKVGSPAPRVILVGHTHLPVYFREDQGDGDAGYEQVKAAPGVPVELGEARWILNPGSVGQPRDGDPRASYLIVDEGAGTAELRRVRYEVAAVQKTMEQRGFPRTLIRRLEHGR